MDKSNVLLLGNDTAYFYAFSVIGVIFAVFLCLPILICFVWLSVS
jgi:hypothetical protein